MQPSKSPLCQDVHAAVKIATMPAVEAPRASKQGAAAYIHTPVISVTGVFKMGGKKNQMNSDAHHGEAIASMLIAGGAAGAAVEHHAARLCGGVHALCGCAQRGARDCAGPS
jgi:hypothetical protein